MARARNIKPGFFKNEELAELPFECRLLFIGLWTLADREGRLEDRPRRIKMEIFPADSIDCDAALQSLHDSALIRRYTIQGNAYIEIPTFTTHQKPHPREAASTLPEYQGDTKATPRHDLGNTKALPSPADVLNPDVLNPESLIKSSRPAKPAGHALPPGFVRFWNTYPSGLRRAKKADCLKRWKKNRLEEIANQIVEHVEAMKQTRDWLEGFEPMTLTYLNGRRWEDGPPEAQADPAKAALNAYLEKLNAAH